MYSDDSSYIVRVFQWGHTETGSYKGRLRSNAEGTSTDYLYDKAHTLEYPN